MKSSHILSLILGAKPKDETEIAAAFDDITAMLEEAKLSLDLPAVDTFTVPEITWM